MENSQTPYERLLPLILLLVLSLIWGSSFILMKKSLVVFSPVQVAAGRVTFAFLAMVVFAVYHIRQLPKDRVKYILLMGLFGNLIPAFLFAVAVSELKSSLTGVLNALTPLFTLLLGVVMFSVPLRRAQMLGLGLGFLGSAGLSFVDSDGGLGQMNWFVLWVVAATICYAISTNIIKTHLGGLKSLHLTSFAMLFVGPPAMVYLFTTDFVERFDNEQAWGALFYLFILGAVATGFALVLFNKLVRLTSAVFASSVTYVIPIVAVFWGLVDGEQLYALHYLGMGCILAGIYVVNKNR